MLFKNGKIFSQGKDEYGPNGVDNKNLPTTVGRPPTDISFTPENNVLSFEQVLISLFCVIFPNEILEVFQEKKKKRKHACTIELTSQLPGKVCLKNPGIVGKVISFHLEIRKWYLSKRKPLLI